MQAALNNNLTLGTYSSFLSGYDFVESEPKKFCSRYYDPSTGRFLQQDPDPGKLASPNTFLSKYIYAGNNPVMFSDPSGEFFPLLIAAAWFLVDVAVVAIGSGLAAGVLAGVIAGAAAKGSFWAAFSAAFGLGAVIMAMGTTAIQAQLFVGALGAGVGAYAGYQTSGLGGALLGIAGGFIGGYLGAMGGVTGYDAFKNPKNLTVAARLWNGVKGIGAGLFDPPLIDPGSLPTNSCTVPGCSTMPRPRM